MFVLDLAENLLQHVFERNDARRAAEFVDHNGDVRTVLDKILQHQLQRHGFGNEIDLHHHVGNTGRTGEQTLRVDIADDVVDALAPDEDARILGIDETRRELFDGRIVDVHCLDVHARHHAVAHPQVGEIQRVLEQLQLVVGFGTRLGTVGVEQRREVLAVETVRRRPLFDAAARQTQDTVRNERRQPRDRIEQQIEEIDYRRQRAVIEVRIVAEDRLGQEFREKDDDDGRNGGFDRHGTVPGDALPPQRVENTAQQQRHVERVDDQRDIVAHQNRGDILSGVAGEYIRYAVEHAALLAVDLQFQAVLARKSDLHTRKECRQQQHQDNQYDRSKHLLLG